MRRPRRSLQSRFQEIAHSRKDLAIDTAMSLALSAVLPPLIAIPISASMDTALDEATDDTPIEVYGYIEQGPQRPVFRTTRRDTWIDELEFQRELDAIDAM